MKTTGRGHNVLPQSALRQGFQALPFTIYHKITSNVNKSYLANNGVEPQAS